VHKQVSDSDSGEPLDTNLISDSIKQLVVCHYVINYLIVQCNYLFKL